MGGLVQPSVMRVGEGYYSFTGGGYMKWNSEKTEKSRARLEELWIIPDVLVVTAGLPRVARVFSLPESSGGHLGPIFRDVCRRFPARIL